MNKKALSETDIRSKFITPALCGPGGAGWNLMTQIREEAYFTKGRVVVRGKTVQRGKAKKADYLLYYKPNIPIAVIEAKDNNHSVGDGMQQADRKPCEEKMQRLPAMIREQQAVALNLNACIIHNLQELGHGR